MGCRSATQVRLIERTMREGGRGRGSTAPSSGSARTASNRVSHPRPHRPGAIRRTMPIKGARSHTPSSASNGSAPVPRTHHHSASHRPQQHRSCWHRPSHLPHRPTCRRPAASWAAAWSVSIVRVPLCFVSRISISNVLYAIPRLLYSCFVYIFMIYAFLPLGL